MTMRLNNISPAPGSKKIRLRVGRGASAGQGKTCGRGVKGQRARKGGYHKVGFEGGQMPLQRRLPKIGLPLEDCADGCRSAPVGACKSRRATSSIWQSLKAANLVPAQALRARIVAVRRSRRGRDGQGRARDQGRARGDRRRRRQDRS